MGQLNSTHELMGQMSWWVNWFDE